MEIRLREDPQPIVHIPDAPEHWLTLHQTATGASLAAGAVAYAVTALSGKTVSSLFSNTIRLGGTACSYAGRLFAGDAVGLSIFAGSQTAAYAVDEIGAVTTQASSAIASSLAAAIVGSSVLLCSTVYDIYTQKQRAPALSIPSTHSIQCLDSVEEIQVGDAVVYLLEDKKPEPHVEVLAQLQPQDEPEPDRTPCQGPPQEGVSE